MRGKILFGVGLATGYVLGTRAGREQYDKMKAAVQRFWQDPRVQKQVKQAEEFAKDKGPEVAGFVSDNVKKVANQVAPKKTPAAGSGSTGPGK